MDQPFLVTGARGMLGRQLMQAPGAEGTHRAETDLADPDAVRALFSTRGPFAGVLHAAGFTGVDLAEQHPDQARRDNVTATRVLAEACERARIPMLLVSTDFVFDGTSHRRYREQDAPHPLGIYGQTKREAEQALLEICGDRALIVRTQWLYGPFADHFPARILAATEPPRVVDDQRGCPTSTLQLAPALWELLRSGQSGIYHAACEGECSWYEFARFIRPSDVRPCSSAEFPRAARRPAYSVLDCSKLTALRGRSLADWQAAWKEYKRSMER